MAQQGQDNEGKGQTQQYVVKTEFTDDKGRNWTVGTAFTGNEEAIRKALAAGQIAQRPVGEQKPA